MSRTYVLYFTHLARMSVCPYELLTVIKNEKSSIKTNSAQTFSVDAMRLISQTHGGGLAVFCVICDL